MNRKAFTLTELLVVFLIIAIVAGLALSGFLVARGKALESRCLSNQRQIGVAIRQYMDDYDTFPSVTAWRAWTRTHPVLLCPAAPKIPPLLDPIPGDNGIVGLPGYAYNSYLVHRGKDFEPRRADDVAFPATTVLILDNAPERYLVAAPNQCTLPLHGPCQNSEQGWKRHNGGAVYTFVDGHSKWLRPESIMVSMSFQDDPGNDGVHPSFATWPFGTHLENQ